ncbi:MAG: extracellular solute-binding protein [Anaerolineae bacterium]|nr:extracellular solute-binding protein [Anaerolineae bacterium]
MWLSILLAVVLLAACQAPSPTAPATQARPEQTEAATEAPTSPATQAASGEEQVLKVWHYESEDGAMGKAWAAAIQKFEDTHPGVTVQLEQRGFEEIRQTAPMILNSDEVPDVMEYNKGNATAGFLAQQGLLTDITSEAQARGWDKILSPGLQATCRYENGIMGSGPWYGVTNYGEYVMVYYNKDMFVQGGVEVPTTLDEFEAAMDKFVQAGVTPLSVGASEYPAQQIWYELVLSKADRDFINAYELYQGDVDFYGPEFAFGTERMAEWVQKGYISADATSMPAEDMGVAFENGEYPIMISGSWWYGRLMTEITKFEWGTFLFPGNKFHPGSGGNIWIVPANAKNKDLAYDFIDITMQPDIQTILGNAGGIPVNADMLQITDPKIQELIQNFNTIGQEDGLAFYPDWPAPGYYDTLVSAVQELIAGTKTRDQMLTDIQAPYQEYRASLGK